MIRHAKIDRYVFEQLLRADPDTSERIRAARKQAPWFTEELLADVFYSFYLPSPAEEAGGSEPPFHKWLIAALREQYLYTLIRPRTAGAPAAAFRTALKSLMWLSAEYAAEAERRRKDQRSMPVLAEQPAAAGEKPGAGMGKDRGDEHAAPASSRSDRKLPSAAGEATLAERVSAEQMEKLKRMNYRLEAGKKEVEERRNAADARPLAEAEVAALRERVAELREAMRVDFIRREKWKKKLEKAESELAGRQKALDRLIEAEKQRVSLLEHELGDWLNGSLKETLTAEERDTKFVDELIRASLLFANRRWGSDLGRLRRQAYSEYLVWVERLKRHPDLLAMLEEVGRHTARLTRDIRNRRTRMAPDRYDELGLSSDLAHMLPTEGILLADPDYEAYFMQRWLDGKLMTYRAHGTGKDQGRGPVICLLDSSHSMRGAKQRLAQIFVMTFAAITLQQQRDFILLLFGAKGELVERPLFHRRPDWPSFYALSQLAFGGGTNFDTPLRRGMQLIREAKGFADADLVMVTDGIGAVSAPVRGELAELGASVSLRLHTLVIGSARQHLIAPYDIAGVSHTLRFAAQWDAQEDPAAQLLLDASSVMKS